MTYEILTETKMYLLYFCTMLALQSIVLCPLALKYPVLSQNNIPVSSHENVPVPLHENS